MTSAVQLPEQPKRVPWVTALGALSQRWEDYKKTPVDMTISPVDDMLGKGGVSHYRQVGTSALEVISQAMLLGRKTTFPKILDLPCGGGRVTRHLVKFFPESEIYVCDAEKPKEDFVASHFNLPRYETPIDFAGEPSQRVDLIFVGSLFTHLNQDLFKAAMLYLISALEPGGLLIATLHGRDRANVFVRRQREQAATRQGLPAPRAELLKNIEKHFFAEGFTFQQRTVVGTIPYGVTFSAPSWILKLAEARQDVTILGLQEAGWAGNQDVLVLSKKAPPTI